MAEITQELVRSMFDYKDGKLFWKIRTAKCVKIGNRAGNERTDGRRMVRINYKEYYEHIIIFLWHEGYIPERVDHENRDYTNSKIENLRAATTRNNNCNRSAKKNGASKYLGVHRHRNNWQSSIRVDRKPIYIGTFETQEQAALAYNRKAVLYHKEFANLNIINNA